MDVKEFSSQVLLIKKIFESHSLTLGFAESCTGGLLSAAIVAESGVSSFFKGSVVSYAGSVKESVLSVPHSILQQEGEVSVLTAKAMAQGGKNLLQVDWCVAVTGIAGPGGGVKDKPVGTVCFGLVGPQFEEQKRTCFSSASGHFQPDSAREDIQRQSVIFAFDFLLSAVR